MSNNIATPHKDVRGSKATDGHFTESEGAGTYGPSAFMNQVFTSITPKKYEASAKPVAPKAGPAGDPITLMIAENPEMNASTFFNLLKSKGFVISPPSKEADASSSNVAALRSDIKKESGIGFRTRSFLEAQTPVNDNKAGTTRYKVVLLEEGMGNFNNGCYYSKEALQTAIPIFEGKKIYADHPAESESTERPERSVRDILGHFENVCLQESKDGQTQLVGDVVVMGGQSYQWARELMEHSVQYAKKFPDKEFVGLSINASGASEEMRLDDVLKKGIPEGAVPKIQEAKSKGIEKLIYVSSFTEAVSCDLVTEAGAGGKILELIEGNKDKQNPKSEGKKMDKDLKKEADGEQPAVDQGDHADAAQDMELIKAMIKKYMGDDSGEISEEECNLVKEAYEANKEMGIESEAAESKAVEYLKASKHMAAKREAKAAEAKAAGDQGDASDKKDGEDKPVQKESGVKESAADKTEIEKLKEENAKLAGELASFRESDKKKSVQMHVEKLCKESKLLNTVTASFKKLVETAKSTEEVDKAWAVFQEGYRSRKSNAEGGLDFSGMTIESEKTTFVESKGGAINFGACVLE